MLKVWTDEATAAQWDCFEGTVWHIFRDAATQDNNITLEEYTSWMWHHLMKSFEPLILQHINTLPSMLLEPTDLQRMLYLLPFTQSSITLRTITAMLECLLISAQHSTQSRPWIWLIMLSVSGYWTFVIIYLNLTQSTDEALISSGIWSWIKVLDKIKFWPDDLRKV